MRAHEKDAFYCVFAVNPTHSRREAYAAQPTLKNGAKRTHVGNVVKCLLSEVLQTPVATSTPNVQAVVGTCVNNDCARVFFCSKSPRPKG